MDYAAQTLGTINDTDTSGFADSLRNAQGSMQNVSGERDGEDDEKKTSLRDHRQRATETSNRLDQMSGQASDVKRMPRRDVEQMRSDMKDMHQNTQSTSNEHRGADEQAGEHYDTALEHMNNANQWSDSLGGCFDQSDAVVEAMRAAQEALNQVAAQ
jgi:methyl-accepting chemotaxis protein